MLGEVGEYVVSPVLCESRNYALHPVVFFVFFEHLHPYAVAFKVIAHTSIAHHQTLNIVANF